MNRESESRDERREYTTPKLTVYGDVRKLTQTGGSGSSDFGGPGVMAVAHGMSGH